METPFIEFRDITKRFNGNTVLDKINLKIFEGQVTTIIGKSGSGKSVMLKLIIGLLSPDEGTILIKGQEISLLPRSERSACLHQVSYMFQNNALFDSMTAYENIAFPLQQTTSLSSGEIDAKVRERLKLAEITEMAHKYPAELSGGTQKRVALSRALITDPKIVLFDEPTTGQDIVRRNAILSMISEYQKKFGFTAVIISHDIPDVFFVSNRVLVLHEGEIAFEGTPEELDDFEHPFVDEFITSIEGFQERLTGLYSKRTFKMRYQSALNRKNLNETFVAILFTLPDFGILGETLGHAKGQGLIKALGNYINKHFGAVGGFSARQKRNQFITVLPFSDYSEAEQLIADFAADLREEGLASIEMDVLPDGECVEFLILAGFAEGRSGEDDISHVTGKAFDTQREIARVRCKKEMQLS